MIIGTAGHIDHGKTALVHALTGVDTDRLKEEKARGISIDLGFAYLPGLDDLTLSFVDVPGHEKFVHNMLAGAAGIDFVLLVVAADDGPMPQTIEHLAIVDLLGIRRGLVALTKVDRVDAEVREKICAEIARIVKGTCLDGAEIVQVSPISGEGIDVLRRKLFAMAQATEERADSTCFRLAIDRSFTLAGTGTVVTGTVMSGTVFVGDKVTVSPSGLTARVRSLHTHNRPAEYGKIGQRCALNLTGEEISKDSVTRGEIALDPALHAPTDRIDVRLRLLATERKPVEPWKPARLHHATAEVGAHILPLGDRAIEPGEEALAQLVLDRPIAAAAGDRFIIRDTSAQRTIGGGSFLDLRPPSRKRRTEARLAQLRALSLGEPARVLEALLGLPPCFVDLNGFARDWALSDSTMVSIAGAADLISFSAAGTVYGMSCSAALQLRRDVLARLKEFHSHNPDLAGIGLEKLRLQLAAAMPTPAFLAFLQPFIRDKQISVNGAWLRLATHEVHLTPQDEKLWGRVRPRIGGALRFKPPRVRDLGQQLGVCEADIRGLLKSLGRMGKVDEIAHDHFFLRPTVAEMVEHMVTLAAKAANGEFTVAQFRDRVDNGRKVAIQSLEFFDRHGVTLRRADVRRINPHRLDLFRDQSGSKDRAA